MNSEYIDYEIIDSKNLNKKTDHKIELFIITPQAINKALRKCGFNMLPERELIYFANVLSTNINNVNEISMFLSVVFYRTRGLVQFEERLAPGGSYLDMIYKDMHVEKAALYYGRGHILLKWTSNYTLISQMLGQGNSIVREPEQVKDVPEISATSAIVLWQFVFDNYDFRKSTYCQAMSKIWYRLEKRMPTHKMLLDMYTYYFRISTLFEVRVIYLEFFTEPKKTIMQKIMYIPKIIFKSLYCTARKPVEACENAKERFFDDKK